MIRHSEGRHAKYVPPPVAALALVSVLVGTASWVLLVVTYQRGGGIPERPVSQSLLLLANIRLQPAVIFVADPNTKAPRLNRGRWADHAHRSATALGRGRWAHRLETAMRTRRVALRPSLVVAVFLSLHPLNASAQSTANTADPTAETRSVAEYQVKTRNWGAPVRLQSGAPHELSTLRRIRAAVRWSSDPVAARTGRVPDAPANGWLTRAVSRELASMNLSEADPDSALLRRQPPVAKKRSWIGRHPVLFGTLAGFGAGFLIGYLPGDDGVFDDFVAEFNGLVLGGVGAGVGALVGAVATQ